MSKNDSVGVQAIIQARAGSTRLHRKTLERIGPYRTMLEWVIHRTQQARLIDRVVVATSCQSNDDDVVVIAEKAGVICIRGSEDDVLGRFAQTLAHYPALTVARITGDNPLLDSQFLDEMIRAHVDSESDYTGAVGVAPLGATAEVVSGAALLLAGKEAKGANFREHVTPFFYAGPKEFRRFALQVPDRFVDRGYRLTVDTEDDLCLMRELYGRLSKAGKKFDLPNAVALLDSAPELALINSSVRQKGWSE